MSTQEKMTEALQYATSLEKDVWQTTPLRLSKVVEQSAELLRTLVSIAAELQTEMVKESQRTAAQKLRAEQFEQRLDMANKMSSEARAELAALKAAPAATRPTQQGLDAQRWQIVHDHIGGEYIAGRACFVVHVQPMSGANIMRGSVAEHFTKAVDDIAAQIKIADQAKQVGLT